MPINQIKSGRHGARIPPAAAFASILWVVGSIYNERGYDCIMTSGLEGEHGWSSEHFKGDAVDFRTRHIHPESEKEALAVAVRKALGDDFDVVFHPPGGRVPEHLHVEYDPKRPIT